MQNKYKKQEIHHIAKRIGVVMYQWKNKDKLNLSEATYVLYIILWIRVIVKAKIELNPEVNEFKTFLKPWLTCPQSLLKLLGFSICHCKNNTNNS
jgi:hypothetical protein